MGRRAAARLLPRAVSFVLGCALLISPSAAQPGDRPRLLRWENTPAPIRSRLQTKGISSATFPAYIARLHREHERRVREGDLDHLVFYLLQSTHFTQQPSIEPALSARSLVDGLPAGQKQAFLEDGRIPSERLPSNVRSRMSALLAAMDSADPDPRLAYFRGLVRANLGGRESRERALAGEYFRAMRFLYEKEFVAQRSDRPQEAVAELYRARGLSTDTAVEAGYLVYLGLGIARSLEPDHRVRRVLIVGPGLDLAPRTALIEAGPPESYQPWAVIDALLGLGLARADDLHIVAADINPRVLEHLRQSRAKPPRLTLVSGIAQTADVAFTPEYREYFLQLGRALGKVETGNGGGPHLAKRVIVEPALTSLLDARPLDVVTETLEGPPFDLAIATNILPYFDDLELMLAVNNVSQMLGSGGIFLHNEPRPAMQEAATAAGLEFEQARQAVIATVRGAPAPLGDTVLLYRKTRR